MLGNTQQVKDWQRAESNRDPGKEGVSTGEGDTDSGKEEIEVKRPGDRNRVRPLGRGEAKERTRTKGQGCRMEERGPCRATSILNCAPTAPGAPLSGGQQW